MTRHAARGHRHGFTMIELLVVIVIIALLMGLLLPAIAGAVRSARNAAVQAEISSLAQALADFKNKKGDYPPSRIAIREDGGYNPGDTTTLNKTPSSMAPDHNGSTGDVLLGTLYLRGATAFRKFWPRVNLVNGSAFFAGTKGGAPSTGWYDFNGDGVFGGNTVIVLQGNQCLVFFLGGIPQPSFDSSGNVTGILGVTGFGKNPLNPFSNSIISTPANPMSSSNRDAPLYEFNAGRLRLDANGMALYVDSLTGTNNLSSTANTSFSGAYAYFSTNNGAGYDPNDMNDIDGTYEIDANAQSPINLTFMNTQGGTTSSPSPNPYTSGMPSGVASVGYINGQSFQLFSAGADGVFGVGGYYNSTNSGALALPAENSLSNSTDPALRTLEWDNLTNFHNGRLQ